MINQHYTGHRGQRHAGSDVYCPARPAACVFARTKLLMHKTAAGSLPSETAALALGHRNSIWSYSFRHPCGPKRLAPLSAAAVKAGSALEAPPRSSTAQLLTGPPAERVQRLETLVELKKLYRNCIRADTLLSAPEPVYTTSEQGVRQENAAMLSSDSYSSSVDSNANSVDEEAERLQAAVEVVAEMQLTAEQLKTGVRALQQGFGNSLFGAENGAATEAAIRLRAKGYSSDLKQRAAGELPLLPFSSEAQAQAACDLRNSRYNKRLQVVVDDLQQASEAAGSISPSSSLPDRLNQAEKVAEKFVARRIKPALQRAREKQLLEVLSDSGNYLKGLWSRLNGGGGRSRRSLPPELVLPPTTKRQIEKRISELGLQLEGLEKRLVEASKAREARLRKAGAAGRVAVAIQLRSMDAEVIAISRLLAVKTLQLEMEYIYQSLEDEALDTSADEMLRNARGPALAREGSTTELALLVAEYGLLLEQLDVLVASIENQMGSAAGSSSSHGFNHSSATTSSNSDSTKAGLSLIDEDILEELAAEIPDLRNRVGISDAQVFGANPLSPTRLKLQAQESSFKVLEGVNFLLRGVRLLLSDVGNAGRLFSKAALGGNLKAREVAALRRTARDLLTFIPFIIILIIPLTPLGHVLVFSFIQRYFPGFFPSQFTNQRQDLMMRYEELQRQLIDAQAAAEVEEEEAELARAAAAVARLTAPDYEVSALPTSSSSSSRGSNNSSSKAKKGVKEEVTPDEAGAGPAAAKLRMLEEQVQEAREEVHNASEEDGPASAMSVRH